MDIANLYYTKCKVNDSPFEYLFISSRWEDYEVITASLTVLCTKMPIHVAIKNLSVDIRTHKFLLKKLLIHAYVHN